MGGESGEGWEEVVEECGWRVGREWVEGRKNVEGRKKEWRGGKRVGVRWEEWRWI